MFPAQPNRSLIDGVACLQALAVADSPVGVRALARSLGLEPTRAHRLLRTLAALGFAARTPAGRYAAGPGMHVLAAQALFGSGLLRRALPVLAGLADGRHVVALGVRWRRWVCYVYHATPDTPPLEGIGRVGLFPAERSSIGRVLLALEDEVTVRAAYADAPEVVDGLRRAAPDIRRRGYAFVPREGRAPASLAIALGTPPYAALALAGPISARERPALLRRLRAAAAAIDRETEPEERKRT